MNLVRGNTIVVYVILVMAEAVLFPRPGRAQQLASGEFKLAREIRWENSVLPMGDFVYFVDSSLWPAVVRVQQKDGSFSGVFISQSFLRRETAGNSGIVTASEGNESYVYSLHLQGLGGELVFSAPHTETGKQPADSIHAEKAGDPSVRTLEHVTILNPNHEKISAQDAEKIYLRACEGVEKEFRRPNSDRPRLVLRLGAGDNLLRYPMHEIQLKKWDEYRFADAVVELALHEMLPPEERARLGYTAVREAAETVNICELKACLK